MTWHTVMHRSGVDAFFNIFSDRARFSKCDDLSHRETYCHKVTPGFTVLGLRFGGKYNYVMEYVKEHQHLRSQWLYYNLYNTEIFVNILHKVTL